MRATPIDQQHQAELEQQAELLVQAALCMNIHERIEAAAVDWEAGTRLLESEQPAVQHLGTLFLLQALATTPSPMREVAGQLLAEMQPGCIEPEPP